MIRTLVGSTLAALACATVVAQPICNHDSSAAAATARLRAAMAHGRFIAYQPTALQVVNGRPTPSGERAFAYFSAFDAPWRVHDANPVPGEHPAEAHWGLYDAQRRPKPVVAQLPLLNAPAAP